MRRVSAILACATAVITFAWMGCGEPTSRAFDPEAEGSGLFDPDASSKGSPNGCAAGCPRGLECVGDRCLPPQGKCTGGASDPAPCQYDTYCDVSTGACVPFGNGKDSDPSCHQLIAAGSFAPKVKCEFPAQVPIIGDFFPNHVDVQATPMVARLNGPIAPPSIVVPFTQPVTNSYTEAFGVIRVLRGTDCAQEAVIGGVDFDGDGAVDWARSSSSVALADLDGDKLPDIIAYMSSGAGGANETLMAFTRKSGSWQPLWATRKATMQDGVTIFRANLPLVSSYGLGHWAGPSVHDLDDDGKPEIIREGWIFDGATGKLRAGLPATYATYAFGIPPVLANLDGDAKIEMTNGARVWEFDGATNSWTEDVAYAAHTSNPGWAAVADFNPYDGTNTPEIAVASLGTITVYKTDHTVFMNMTMVVPGGGGGPPTIADFDGDGLPEVALAGAEYYTVFDPDCQATPRPGGKCVDRTHCDFTGAGCPNLVLWSRATQDISSQFTGSSIFDFEADGKAEAVYADECFTRVYSGTEGRVVFSRYRSSGTWLENPIVADVDGDYRAELVVPSNMATSFGPAGIPCTRNIEQGDIDAQFVGLVCLENKDCVSNVCDAGLCRCASSADCCAEKDIAKCETFGTKCATAPAGTAGLGKTCRANHPRGAQGIRVFEDAADRWVRSRTIWNQHAYAVSHVEEDGTIPKTSAWNKNWNVPNLNNFRQNVPGNQNATDIGDLTSQVTTAFRCDKGQAVLTSSICNRGSAPVGAGISVGFYVGGANVCATRTTSAIAVGACEAVTCTWASPPTSPTDVTVVPNDDGAIAQCNTSNDRGLISQVACSTPR